MSASLRLSLWQKLSSNWKGSHNIASLDSFRTFWMASLVFLQFLRISSCYCRLSSVSESSWRALNKASDLRIETMFPLTFTLMLFSVTTVGIAVCIGFGIDLNRYMRCWSVSAADMFDVIVGEVELSGSRVPTLFVASIRVDDSLSWAWYCKRKASTGIWEAHSKQSSAENLLRWFLTNMPAHRRSISLSESKSLAILMIFLAYCSGSLDMPSVGKS